MKNYYRLFDTYMTDLAGIHAVVALEGKPVTKALTRQFYKGQIFWNEKGFRATFIKYRSGNIKVLSLSKEEYLMDFLTALNEHMEKRRAFLWFRKFSSYLYLVASLAFLFLFMLYAVNKNLSGTLAAAIVLFALRLFYVFCRNRVR